MFGISFLITLNIYKDYFEGHQGLHKLHESGAKFCLCKLWLEIDFAFIFLLKKLLCLYTVGFCDQGAFVSSSCGDLKNFVAKILLKLVIKSRIGICAIG